MEARRARPRAARPASHVDDLRRTKLKTEIVHGELIVILPSGAAPATAAGNILVSLHLHGKEHGGGCAYASRVAYLVDLPHRLALCPDASWYTGPPWPTGYPYGAPPFAVEVRDAVDYGDDAERRMAAKRADYFAAGTQVVWDVDVLEDECIRVYRANDPDAPVVFGLGDVADAEPAVPEWRFEVDELFR